MGDIHAVQQDLTGGGLINTGNDLRQRGFAAAVGSGDSDKALLHGQVDIVQDLFIVGGFKADMT